MNDIIKKVESACERLAEATNRTHLARWEDINRLDGTEKQAAKQEFYEDMRRFYHAITPSYLSLPTFEEAIEQRAQELGIKTE